MLLMLALKKIGRRPRLEKATSNRPAIEREKQARECAALYQNNPIPAGSQWKAKITNSHTARHQKACGVSLIPFSFTRRRRLVARMPNIERQFQRGQKMAERHAELRPGAFDYLFPDTPVEVAEHRLRQRKEMALVALAELSDGAPEMLLLGWMKQMGKISHNALWAVLENGFLDVWNRREDRLVDPEDQASVVRLTTRLLALAVNTLASAGAIRALLLMNADPFAPSKPGDPDSRPIWAHSVLRARGAHGGEAANAVIQLAFSLSQPIAIGLAKEGVAETLAAIERQDAEESAFCQANPGKDLPPDLAKRLSDEQWESLCGLESILEGLAASQQTMLSLAPMLSGKNQKPRR
jgi:hypothetical protein